ncbi:Hypothetical_protein [Hexamita inflata]|uniref:Hypothetical_protein n=1 Tax=Hexamita inflata TaxID=28002 RepID=A0AA86QE48_9EUKA|nr:Hypothetical protein HINF_LOCUS45171 [Hexamita inflata]
MIISLRYTYVRQAHLRSQGNQRLGYKHPVAQRSCFVQAVYTGIHLRRTICVSKEAMERLPLSNPGGSLMAYPQPYRSLTAALHFEPGDFTFRNRFSRIVGSGMRRTRRRDQMNPSSTTLNKAGISAMPLQLQRRTPSLIVLGLINVIKIFYYQNHIQNLTKINNNYFSHSLMLHVFNCLRLLRLMS